MTTSAMVRVEGKDVELTNLDKVFYPETGFTKAQVIVSKMAKSLRPGKVLIDWSQNTEHKTMACV
jgi:bifunctional non-homologous end joining protein LigD